ncbi:MAG: hypothetical protein OEX81_04250 [Candidatus Pacebacteria bacterium]|nr:hypothetical protein [Candidatus Paceibacterota bacterium]
MSLETERKEKFNQLPILLRWGKLFDEAKMFAVGYIESFTSETKGVESIKQSQSLFFSPWDIEVTKEGQYFIRKDKKGHDKKGGMFCIKVQKKDDHLIIIIDKSDQYSINALKRLLDQVSEYDDEDSVTLGITA